MNVTEYKLFEIDGSQKGSVTRYRLLRDSTIEPQAKAGSAVYLCIFSDYNCAEDDEIATGRPHLSVTLREDGGYPFFTAPRADLEII